MPPKGNWLRVNRNNPCPVCGKPDWCLIAADGQAAICARLDSPEKCGDAGWLHKLNTAIAPPPAPVPPPSTMARAGVDELHAVYTAMLSLLTLSADHRANLRSRGLSDTEINTLEYKTLPALNRYPIVKRLRSIGYPLAGIPGFYFEKEWRLGGPAGILIPVRDDRRRIQGFQIRRDGAAKPKYVWLSSVRKTGGCSPGAPLHVAYPSPYYIGCQNELGRVWITEGPLKADIAALRLQNIMLAVPGVSNWSSVVLFLQTHYPVRSLVKVVIAFDMDKRKNPAVESHLNELTERLLRFGFPTFHADWNAEQKGIDDLCLTKN